MTGTGESANATEWEHIASIIGTDELTEIHLDNLLLAHGIQAAIGGSRVDAIEVPAPQAEQAAQILRTDARKRDYHISFGAEEVLAAPELKEVAHGVSVSSLLRRTHYASDTALGRLLRDPRMSKLTAKYPHLFSLCVHRRRYHTTPSTFATGWDVSFELHRSARKRDDGCKGWCQLLDDGKAIGFQGAGEWGRFVEI